MKLPNKIFELLQEVFQRYKQDIKSRISAEESLSDQLQFGIVKSCFGIKVNSAFLERIEFDDNNNSWQEVEIITIYTTKNGEFSIGLTSYRKRMQKRCLCCS